MESWNGFLAFGHTFSPTALHIYQTAEAIFMKEKIQLCV